MWIFQYAAQLVIHPWTFASLQPFLMLGYGTIASVTRPGSPVESDQDGMARAGLGVKVAFGERFGLRLEGRVLSPLAFAAKLVPVGDETNYGGPDFQVVGGLYMNFGEVERQIIVREKVVVRESAVDLDPDRDGIVGDADKCPQVAEDKDGFEDDDGCPESDNDKDDIPDAQDKCPLKAETKNGFEDDDGCPEEDLDGDGFLGTQDQCPTEPETKNGYKDDDGCPDEIPAEIRRFTGVIEGINFKTRSTVLLRNSFPILDRAVKVLKDYPDVRLEISGHTDSRGKADFNRDLSQGRAEAVRTYFIKRRINTDRVTAIGYGMDQPMATNRTEAGRSKNRRTEFRIMWDTKAPGK
jgi:OOP family OmpA-OmpF porin